MARVGSYQRDSELTLMLTITTTLSHLLCSNELNNAKIHKLLVGTKMT